MNALVEVQNLGRHFASRRGLFGAPQILRAVNDVSFEIKQGEVVGVVGESGCGKSTLARLILRLIDPSEGKVLFDGVDMTDLTPRDLRALRRRMQMVFQDPYSSIDPRYRVRDTLLEPFRVQRLRLSATAARDKVAELLEMVGLSVEMASSYPHQLSGGQKQRVGIARALALNPSFLVLDEPTASLDVSIQAQIIGLLERLRSELDLTYLFISHDLGLVSYLCDRIIVMYLGRIVETMPRSAITAHHPYTRALLDSNFEPDPTQRRTIARLTDEIPSAFDLPPGCAFASRCDRVTDHCRQVPPALTDMADGHRVACFHPISPDIDTE